MVRDQECECSAPLSASRRPPLLLIGNFLSGVNGSRGVCEDLALRLADSGWSVITTSARPGRMSRLGDMLGTAWRRRQEYEVVQVDVYSGPAFFWAEAACWVLRRARKPYILTLHGGNLPGFARRRPGRVRRLLASAAVVTAPSRFLVEQMRGYRSDLRLIPNPLQASAYPFQVRCQPRPHLVWLRAFHQIYNPSLAPRVVSLLAAEFPEVRLTMVGPDKDGSLNRCRELAQSLGVTDRIRWVDRVPKADVPEWISQGDIFLNTTNFDNTPVSVLEAMACGLCVVSTNVGGLPYLLDDGQDALLVPPDDPHAMANAVRRTLTEPGMAERLSRSARMKVEQFDWTVILPQWEHLLGTVARLTGR